MSSKAIKTQESKSQTVVNVVSQMQSDGEATYEFVDNRPEAIIQRKLQEYANNSPQAKHLAHMQGVANNHTTQQQQPPEVSGQAIQKKKLKLLTQQLKSRKAKRSGKTTRGYLTI